MRLRRSVEEAGSVEEEEEERENVTACLNNLTIETAETEEEAAERLGIVLGMEVDGDSEDEVEGEEEGVGDQGALGSL